MYLYWNCKIVVLDFLISGFRLVFLLFLMFCVVVVVWEVWFWLGFGICCLGFLCWFCLFLGVFVRVVFNFICFLILFFVGFFLGCLDCELVLGVLEVKFFFLEWVFGCLYVVVLFCLSWYWWRSDWIVFLEWVSWVMEGYSVEELLVKVEWDEVEKL